MQAWILTTEEDTKAFESQFLLGCRGLMDMRFTDFVDVYFEDMAPKLRDYTRRTREYMLNSKVIRHAIAPTRRVDRGERR